MNQKQKDTENSTNSAETDNKENSPLIERENIEDTPFWIVGNKERGYKITWGRYTFNDEPLPDKEITLEWFKIHTWDIILHMISIGIAQSEEIIKSKI